MLKISVPKIDLKLSWTEVVHCRWKFLKVGFANRLQLGVVSLNEVRMYNKCVIHLIMP